MEKDYAAISIANGLLARVSDLMKSINSKDLLKAEYYCTVANAIKLTSALADNDLKTLTPKADADICKAQLAAMTDYIEILEKRLIAENMSELIVSVRKPVTIICYGKEEVWDSRKEAKDFYLDGIMNSEGSERDRYINIYFGLKEGKDICRDDGL